MTDPTLRRGGALGSPLTVMLPAIASFLVVLVLLTARVSTGHDPALSASASSSLVVPRGASSSIRTTASGRAITVPASGEAASPVQPQPQTGGLVTRTSGASAPGRERDE